MPGKCTSTLEKEEECEVPSFKKKNCRHAAFLHDKSRLIYSAEDAAVIAKEVSKRISKQARDDPVH